LASHPSTNATRWLVANKVAFTPFSFPWVEKGGTRHSSEQLGVSEHAIIKTLITETESGVTLCVLMHGDKQLSTKALCRELGCRNIEMCEPGRAQRMTGYQVGGTSPFGLRTPMPVYVQATILDLSSIHINGGGRGFLVQIDPQVLIDTLGGIAVECARDR
jgi:Cys-tRNA(Pro) deacylase